MHTFQNDFFIFHGPNQRDTVSEQGPFQPSCLLMTAYIPDEGTCSITPAPTLI